MCFFKSVTLSLIFSANLFANPQLVPTDRDVSQAIYDICGDSWCEGDFNYDFFEVNFVCGGVEVVYDLLVEEKKYPQQCFLLGFLNPTDTLDLKNTFPSLNYDFYHELGMCFTANEAELRQILNKR